MTVDDPNRRVPDEPVAVDVHHDGEWWPGRLLEWSRWNGSWRAYVSWTVAPGATFMKWVNGDRVRPRQ